MSWVSEHFTAALTVQS